jgi:hypothetical protein
MAAFEIFKPFVWFNRKTSLKPGRPAGNLYAYYKYVLRWDDERIFALFPHLRI